MMAVSEKREGTELRAIRSSGGSTAGLLVGYASVFDSPSQDLGGFVEIVRAGAFTDTLASRDSDPLALVHHLPHLVLGRRSAGTLRLSEDSKGLRFEIDLPDTQVARDLWVSVDRGDIRGASFSFTVPKGGEKWTKSANGLATRYLQKVNLHEITVTAQPAYDATVAQARAMAESLSMALRRSIPRRPRAQRARRFLETV